MNQKSESFLCRMLKDQRGQALPIVAFILVGVLGMGGLIVDSTHLYVSYNELQASTDAAVLAGAAFLPNATATTEATTYSAVSGSNNAQPNLPNVTMVSGYPLLRCLTTLTNEGIACVAPANANAIQVKQQAVVSTYFVRIFGLKSVTITASATAAMRGAITSPYNVAIIVDTTASMTDTDSDSQCNSTRLACALAGVQVLLHDMSPCISSDSTCTVTNGNAANSVDRVSLFAFPNATVGTVSDDYNCGKTNPTIEPYTFPTPRATTYAPTSSPTSTPTYQILNYSSDYRTSDTATSLNTGSNIVISSGGKSGCTGMQAPGGEGTYYAGAIYAAQSTLIAEQTANPGSQNVIILISDGNASASQSQMASKAINGTTVTKSGTYPSWINECHQAITAATAARTAGTRVYAVAYGAESSGCTTDTPTITPCSTMEQIASATQYFFSDYTQSGSSSTCVSASQPTTNLNQIFTEIAMDFTVARLIPDGTT
jgi:hypothetical protein